MVPTTSLEPHFLHIHMGRGMPQYLCLDMHQSLAPETQSANLEDPAQAQVLAQMQQALQAVRQQVTVGVVVHGEGVG